MTRRDEGGFALVQATSLWLAAGAVSLLVLALVGSEIRQTSQELRHQQAYANALAGLEAGLNRIRTAVDPANGNGVLSLLPCTGTTSATVVSGGVGSTDADTWSTAIYYLGSDPTGLPVAQIRAAALPCPLTVAPSFAYLLSTGTSGSTGSPGKRTLHAVYRFALTNRQQTGGAIAYGGRCWDVGDTPDVGGYVTFQPCLAVGTPRQSWRYRPDLSLQWTGDLTADLCLDYAQQLPAPTMRFVTLQRCVGDGRLGTAYDPIEGLYPLPAQQYQEFAGDGAYYDVTASGDRGNECLNGYDPATATVNVAPTGAIVTLLSIAYCNGGPSRVQPSPEVGAGPATGVTDGMPAPSGQLVSLSYTARCLDVKGKVPAQGLIDYPCKATPDMTLVDGNQQFRYSGTTTVPGTITTAMAGWYSTVCLDYTGLTVTLLACTPGKPSQQWQFAGSAPSQYVDAFTIKNDLGQCLQAGDPAIDRTVVLAPCSGRDDQKWNAPPRADSSRLEDLGES